jgi:hypothetical protein
MYAVSAAVSRVGWRPWLEGIHSNRQSSGSMFSDRARSMQPSAIDCIFNTSNAGQCSNGPDINSPS